jgi:hypothetical protein
MEETKCLKPSDSGHDIQHRRARYCERSPGPAWSETLACTDAPCTGTGRSLDWPLALLGSDGPQRLGGRTLIGAVKPFRGGHGSPLTLYLRFTTSYRHVEELLAERGLSSKIVQFCTAGSRTHRWREMDSNLWYAHSASG